MHAVVMFGSQMDSKRFRQTSGNLQDASNEDCGFRVDAPFAISAALLFAQERDESYLVQYATDVKNLLFLVRLNSHARLGVFHTIFNTKRSHSYFFPKISDSNS